MQFSQYVMDQIASTNYVEENRNSHVIQIKKAAEKATTEIDSHILRVIGGSMTMIYKSNEQRFSHLFECEGRKSFGPDNLSGEDVDILRHVTKVTVSPWIRTKFSHIVWTITKEDSYGKLAVKGYLEAFERDLDPVHWTLCYEKAEAAYHIVLAMGKKRRYLNKQSLQFGKIF